MRWLIVFLLSSCPLLAFIPLNLTSMQDNNSSEWARFLQLNHCELPCWLDITPGLTTLADAQTKIETVYSDTSLYAITKGVYYYSVMSIPKGYQVRIWLRSDDGAITPKSLVRIIFMELAIVTEKETGHPTVADLKAFLGDPEAVRLSSGLDEPTLSLIYRNSRVYSSIDDIDCDKVLLSQKTTGLALYEEPPSNGAWLSDPQNWIDYDYCYNFKRKLS